jgi:alanyl-tRNA synthetase
MLGNFSVGDYFKRDAIAYAWEILTQVYGLPPELLYPTIHPDDDEAARYWQEIGGFPADGITRLSDNWWGPPGASGPCGPDSEIYCDRGAASATWRSGTWCSCSITRTPRAGARRSRTRISTPAWGWSA